MTIKLGIIADDFTGATDIASFMATSGWRVVQLNGIPTGTVDLASADAVVISLKSRSCAAEQALTLSAHASRWLTTQGCERLYFKYCSTFDSTSAGNIGPVTDFLLAETRAPMAILCPALPINGRTVVHGHLFVNGRLLNESGMENHPLTPMKDANLLRVMEQQAQGTCGLVSLATLGEGKAAVVRRLAQLENEGKRYAVVDALTQNDLLTLADALPHNVLLTGGSGLAGALAARHPQPPQAEEFAPLSTGRTLILAGSCSLMTNQQVAHYREHAPSLALDVERCLNDADYQAELAAWVLTQSAEKAPMIYATRPAEEVKALQERFGVEAVGSAIEHLFAALAVELNGQGVNKFIVAGGETSSLIVQKLSVEGFAIGETIAPGVPWVKDLHRPLWLALKSGNFGDEHFFTKAQEFYHA
ncbi:3-oxo-tetronate kinase [Erwinia sp. 9145]|uniref:3-oxo-tetronate kinase n=1 Tax=Erwinia sp. 9145 TaxID=1500895 RepID=UPI000A40B80F|nr:3-oxo-tetronate kinase [Erwinia sp. 9145]